MLLAIYRLIRQLFTFTTDWVTITDISGIGQGSVQTGSIIVYFDTLPDFTDLSVEIKYTAQVVGGTGTVLSCGSFHTLRNGLTSQELVVNSVQYAYAINTGTTSRTRREITDLKTIGHSTTGIIQDSIAMRVHGKGSADDTSWQIRDIQARLRYKRI